MAAGEGGTPFECPTDIPAPSSDPERLLPRTQILMLRVVFGGDPPLPRPPLRPAGPPSSNVRVWAPGQPFETPAALGPPHTARCKHHQNSTIRLPKRAKKERKFWRERGKNAKFWAPHPSGPHRWKAHFSWFEPPWRPPPGPATHTSLTRTGLTQTARTSQKPPTLKTKSGQTWCWPNWPNFVWPNLGQ